MFSKKKKVPQISLPSNFEHRVHTGFDKKEGRYIGLPLQWASIVGNNQILKSSNRPLPLVDPSAITQTEIMDLKIIVRPQSSLATSITSSDCSQLDIQSFNNSYILPKISHVARSNSLRCSSPVKSHSNRETNIPTVVVEEQTPYQLLHTPYANNIGTQLMLPPNHPSFMKPKLPQYQKQQPPPPFQTNNNNSINGNFNGQLPAPTGITNPETSKPNFHGTMTMPAQPPPTMVDPSIQQKLIQEHNAQRSSLTSSINSGLNSSIDSKNKEQRLTHEQFRAALQMVVSVGDPRENLENFIKIGEGSTGTVCIATEKNTSEFLWVKTNDIN